MPSNFDSVGYSLSYTRDDLCKDALFKIGRLSEGQTPTSQLLTDTAQTLNLIIAEIQNDFSPLWTYIEREITVSAESDNYQYPIFSGNTDFVERKIIFIEDAYAKRATDSDFYKLQLLDNLNIRNRLVRETTSGSICSVAYVGEGKFLFDPTPDVSHVVRFRALTELKEIENGTDNLADSTAFGSPKRWFNFFKYALSAELAEDYGLPEAEKSRFQQKANELFIRGKKGDNVPTAPKRITSAYPNFTRRRR